MKPVLLIVACLSLVGCASSMPQRASVAVPVPCRVQIPERPTWARDALRSGASDYEVAKATMAEREQRAAYELKLEAAAKACH